MIFEATRTDWSGCARSSSAIPTIETNPTVARPIAALLRSSTRKPFGVRRVRIVAKVARSATTPKTPSPERNTSKRFGFLGPDSLGITAPAPAFVVAGSVAADVEDCAIDELDELDVVASVRRGISIGEPSDLVAVGLSLFKTIVVVARPVFGSNSGFGSVGSLS